MSSTGLMFQGKYLLTLMHSEGFALTLLLSERPKLYGILAFLRAIGLRQIQLVQTKVKKSTKGKFLLANTVYAEIFLAI